MKAEDYKNLTEQEQLERLFQGQGFTTEVVRVEDDVKFFDRLDVYDNNSRKGCFFFLEGKQIDNVDKLKNKCKQQK